MSDGLDKAELLPEKEILRRWPLLSLNHLRAARASGTIAWVRGKRGTAWYRPEAVTEYIRKYLEEPCREQPLEAHGLPPSNKGKDTMTASVPPELLERVAARSAARIMKKRH